MAIDIKNILQIVQAKIAGVDSNTSTEDLGYLLNLAKRVDGSLVRSYDSDGALPDATLTTERMAYITSTGVMRFNNGQWDAVSGIADPASEPVVYAFGGTISGYNSGGGTGPSVGYNTIDKFSFTSNDNATDVGDLSVARVFNDGSSSPTSGYTTGGLAPTETRVIDKFPFASDGNASNIGNLTNFMSGGSTNNTETRGYHGGGWYNGGLVSYSFINEISFATDGDATTVGNLSTARYPSTGQSSLTDGYSMNHFIRDKFPFASGGTAVDLGNLPTLRFGSSAGQSSDTNGYYTTPKNDFTTSFIDKYPFASDTYDTSVGTLSVNRYLTTGQSSTTYGYISAGISPSLPPPYISNTVDKFSFASGGNATDVGDVTVGRIRLGGHEY